jgi:hypothetical protein
MLFIYIFAFGVLIIFSVEMINQQQIIITYENGEETNETIQ